MENGYKYYEFDPGQTLIHLLVQKLEYKKLKAVSWFLTPTHSFPRGYAFVNGKFETLGTKPGLKQPERKEIKEK